MHEQQYFYKFTTAETAKKILITQSVRYSSPLLFNDPFDSVRVLQMPASYSEIQKAISEEAANMIEDNVQPSSVIVPEMKLILSLANLFTAKERKILIDELKRPYNTNKLKYQALKDLQAEWTRMIPKSRIFCISEVNDSPVMWAHYANNYKGVVVQFECIDIYESPLLLAEKVNYSDEFPLLGTLDFWRKEITGQTKFDYNQTFKELELSKTTEWSYEKEWRVISFEKKSESLYSDYKIHPREISGIYFGINISEEDRQDIINLRAHQLSHIDLFDLDIDQSRRKIEFKKVITT